MARSRGQLSLRVRDQVALVDSSLVVDRPSIRLALATGQHYPSRLFSRYGDGDGMAIASGVFVWK